MNASTIVLVVAMALTAASLVLGGSLRVAASLVAVGGIATSSAIAVVETVGPWNGGAVVVAALATGWTLGQTAIRRSWTIAGLMLGSFVGMLCVALVGWIASADSPLLDVDLLSPIALLVGTMGSVVLFLEPDAKETQPG